VSLQASQSKSNTHQTLVELLATLIAANQHLDQQLKQRTDELEQVKAQLQTEINRSRQTENALSDRETQLRQIFEYSNDAIFVLDPESDRILEANPKAVQHLKYSREELLSSVRVSAIHPHELEKMIAFSKSVLEKGYGWTNELACRRKDGQIIPGEVSASVIDYNQRRCILALVRDISQRRRAEIALRQSEARFRALVENAADMFLVINPQGQIVNTNQRACDILGYTRDELLHLSIADIDAKYLPHEIVQLRQQFTIGTPYRLESIHRRKDGTTFPIEASICLFESDDSWLELALVRDITERKQAEQAQARLAEIGELAAMIVHEVRNPLTTVLLGLNALQRLNLTDSAQERLDLALEEADRLKRLLNEILLYARPQNLQTVHIELNALVSQLLNSMDDLSLLKKQPIQFFSTLSSVWILGDQDKLKQVFINLIRNACEATNSTGSIVVRLQPGSMPCQVCFSVQNQGTPIPPDIIQRLGTPFFTTKPSGNGLGLAIVKQIVRAHHGELTITSNQEQGTIVSIHLPTLQPISQVMSDLADPFFPEETNV
jgi:two-component system sporulation sensor kinase A